MTYRIYIAASFRHLHAVRLLGRELRIRCPEVEVLDWTTLATPPDGLSAAERRSWMDTDHGDGSPAGGTVFRFCRDACASADLVIYLGTSGQDAGVEVGIAFGSGVDVIGLAGPLESPGLMLHGAVSQWAASVPELLILIEALVRCKSDLNAEPVCDVCPVTGCKGKWMEVLG